MFRSLHMKLVLVLVLLVVSVMTIVGTFLINRVTAYYFDDFTHQLNSVFSAELFSALKADDTPEKLYETLSAFHAELGISGYRNLYILDGQNGTKLLGTSDEPVERTSAIVTALTGKIGQQRRLSGEYLDRAIPIISENQVKYIVYIKDTKTELRDLTSALFSMILRSILLGLVIAVLLSFLLSKTITRPIENLTKSAKLISQGEFKNRLKVHSHDEIGTLTDTFNDMAQVMESTLMQIEQERDKLDTLFRHMSDGVTAFASDGEVVHLNPAAIRLLSLSETSDCSFDSIYRATGLTLAQALDIPAGKSIEKHLTIGERELALQIARFGGDAGERGVLGVIHDVTEQAKLDNSRREFVANVSHELRTPLTNVKSYTETLMETPDAPAELRDKFFSVILNETDRMTRIVKDLLTLSRLDSAKMDWRTSEFSISKSIKTVYTAMELDAHARKHTLLVNIDGELPVITGDRERIEQVLINIVSNAIKYTSDGGTIKIGARFDGALVHITVADNGVGIAKQDLSRVFERFYRVDKARSRAAGGTGLGLAIAREIVEHHGGTINISSAVGKGTTVELTLALNTAGEINED